MPPFSSDLVYRSFAQPGSLGEARLVQIGHYVAFTRDEIHGWLLYNDAAVPSVVGEEMVLKQASLPQGVDT